MVDNMLDFELHRVNSLLYRRSGTVSGYLLTDFAAAFPSVHHAWLFFVIEAMGIPNAILSFFRTLYSNSFTTILFKGRCWASFLFRRGLRQGCPSSMLLFSLGLDPILRWLVAKILHPDDALRGYADDLGFSLRQLAYSLPRLDRAFLIISATSGLTLKLRKCAIVPHYCRDMNKIKLMASLFLSWPCCSLTRAAR